MSQLLDRAPYGPRDETLLLHELEELTRYHLKGCPHYAKIWPGWQPGHRLDELPFLHVGVFKHVELKTPVAGIHYERTLKSSATTGGTSSRIPLDTQSSQHQSRSTGAILKDFLGSAARPLMVLDSSRSLQARGEVSARIAAAMSLRPLATELFFLLEDAEDPASVNWSRLQCVLEKHEHLLVYGFTWILWQAWASATMPEAIRSLLAGKHIHFVHSGGWKRLEALKVNREEFDGRLLRGLAPGSRVLDYYGLVEQVGVIYPLCEAGARHVPVWAGVLVRDPFTLGLVVEGQRGMLQLMNTLARGGPYHNVLTEDMGWIVPGSCPCGRSGPRFELLGRMPKAEVRGCANV